MKQTQAGAFEVKKKAYKAPEIKVYGGVSEQTKGTGEGGPDFDAESYYNGQQLS